MKSIVVKNISKTYPGITSPALDNISLEVDTAEIFGLIGPDGAGKTTLFRILTTLLLADQGSARIEGLDAHARSVEIRIQKAD